MICGLCRKRIATNQQIEYHHPIYKSRGGTSTVPTHKACHRNFHQTHGDFKEWSRIGGMITAMTRRWSFNLKYVKDHPAFEISRKYYLAFYAR
jgi:hypothetical protein